MSDDNNPDNQDLHDDAMEEYFKREALKRTRSTPTDTSNAGREYQKRYGRDHREQIKWKSDQ